MKTFLKTTAFIVICILMPIGFGVAIYEGLELRFSEVDSFTNTIVATLAGFLLFLLFTTIFANLTTKK